MSPRNLLENRPSGEATTKSVQTLEDQTGEHERAIIKLKRTRNSLLKVFKLPPEVLGNIFRWNVIPMDNLWGWEVRSHTFLLVCHHWFEVASRTPELWSFWGTTPEEWKRCYRHSRTTPLDLVLNVNADDGSFDAALHDALQDRATRNTIRRVHIKTKDAKLLNSVISSLTVNPEGFRSSNLESCFLYNHSNTTVNLSNFFAHDHFPKLQYLELNDCVTAGWDYLSSRTGALKTLTLDPCPPSIPTTSHLLSILASNPALVQFSTPVRAATDRSGDRSSFRVPLHHLKDFDLAGDVRDAFGVLHWLDYPGKVFLDLDLRECTVGDFSQVIGPYLRGYFGRRGRSQTGLGLYICQSGDAIEHSFGDVGNLDLGTPADDRVGWFASIGTTLDETLPKDLLERGTLDILAQIPQEDVVSFEVSEEPIAILEAVCTWFPNLRVLQLSKTPLSGLSNLSGDKEVFPSLQRVFLDQMVLHHHDWSPLITFLACRASSGNQLDGIEISDSPHMCTEVVEGIRCLVRHFLIEDPQMQQPCHFNTCPEPQPLASPLSLA